MILNKRKYLINLLKRIPIFQGLEESDYRLIMPLLVPIVYPKDTLIITQNEDDDSMFIIKKGKVEVRREEYGDVVVLGEMQEGAYFGELSLIDNLPRSANVVALGKVEVFRLSRHDFDNLLNNNKKIALTFYRNCLKDSFSRFRNVVTDFTFSQIKLQKKTNQLEQIGMDLSRARSIQDYFINTNDLYNNLDNFKEIKYSHIYNPCLEVGGDFMNVLQYDDCNAGVIIADVEDYGITASLLTGIIKSAVSIVFKKLGLRPKQFVRYLNRHVINTVSDLHATCCYALLNLKEKKISIAKAGNNYPIIWKQKSQRFIEFKCKGIGLGLDPDAEYEQVAVKIAEGDKVLFFTNGITNQTNDRDRPYSRERIMEVFKVLIESGEKDILNNLYNDLREFVDKDKFDDDITLMLVEF